jgi:CDP-glycerol glycerophosphotransferase (TagB/SpsB family)
MKQLVKRMLIWLAAVYIRLMSSFQKTDGRLVLIGAHNGELYGDNSGYLYEWMLYNQKDLKPVWLTDSKDVYHSLIEAGKPVVLQKSWKAIRLMTKAHMGVYTHSLHDLVFDISWIPKRMRLITLRHGKSVKRVRFARKEYKLSPHEFRERQRESELLCCAVSTSEFISDIQEECLQIGREKHVVTGYPRNDVLLTPTEEMRTDWNIFLAGLKPSRVILYAPSWRHGFAPTRFFPMDDFVSENLIEFLEKHHMLLLLRPHMNDLRKFPTAYEELESLARKSRYVRFASHQDIPVVYHFLPFIDVLISDYSSLYHDFLLLDRPMIFIPYDYSEFEQKIGFLYDYFNFLPGPAVYTFTDLCSNLESIMEGRDLYRSSRQKLRDLVHEFKDDKSCSRVSMLIRERSGF